MHVRSSVLKRPASLRLRIYSITGRLRVLLAIF